MARYKDWHMFISLILIRYNELEPTNYVVVRAYGVPLFTFSVFLVRLPYPTNQCNGKLQKSLSLKSSHKKKQKFLKKCYFLFTMLSNVIADAKCHNKAKHSISMLSFWCAFFNAQLLASLDHMNDEWITPLELGKENSSSCMNSIHRPKIGCIHLRHLTSLWNIYTPYVHEINVQFSFTKSIDKRKKRWQTFHFNQYN